MQTLKRLKPAERQRLFTVQADVSVALAFDWLHAVKARPVLMVDRLPYAARLFTVAAVTRPVAKARADGLAIPVEAHAILRHWAQESGWQEQGGHIVRDPRSGEVTGRTHWVGQPSFARGFGYSKHEIVAIVEKAIAGERLGENQRLLVTAMLEELDAVNEGIEGGSHAPQCPF